MPSIHRVLRLVVAACLVAAVVPAAHARPKVPRSVLKEYFERGDKPTSAQFSVTSLDGEPSTFDQPDFLFSIGTGGIHQFEGLGGAALLGDSSGHWLPLDPGEPVGPTSSQFGTLIDSLINRLDDRYLIGLRFPRAGELYYGYLDVTINSPLPAWPGYYGLTIHGWAYETQPNTPITTSFIPAPGSAALALCGLVAVRRRRR